MNRTKAAIVDSFSELLNERPLSKITVKDIVERCGINRNTFYYHFRDIPSLVEETIKDWMDHIIQMYGKLGSPMDCIAPMAQYASAHRSAILHIYRSVQREVFLSHLDRIVLHVVRQYVEEVTADWLSPSVHQAEIELLIKYYKCTFVGGILDWLDCGMEYDLLASTTKICELLSGSGKQALLKCVDPQPKE